MGYVKNKGWETRFPHNLIRVRVQANSSYQIKRVIEAVCKEKGLLEMDRSDVMRNTGEGPRLRQFVTFIIASMYEKDGLPAERYFFRFFLWKFVRPMKRSYKKENRFEREEKRKQMIQEVRELEQKQSQYLYRTSLSQLCSQMHVQLWHCIVILQGLWNQAVRIWK